MTAYVFPPDAAKPLRTVKNLGWLLRHASEVTRLGIIRSHPVNGEATLCATLSDGTWYMCHFASLEVCREWIKRPSLRHVTDVEDLADL